MNTNQPPWLYLDTKTNKITCLQYLPILDADRKYEKVTGLKVSHSIVTDFPKQTFNASDAIKNESYYDKCGVYKENYIPYTKYTEVENGDYLNIFGKFVLINTIKFIAE
jgi:hypothetical protein